MDNKPEVAIAIQNVSKTFKLPLEKNTSIKGAVVNFYKRNRAFEKQRVLKDISFEIKKGEFFGIIGRNGSGKSTLLKVLAGIYIPTEGGVHINGRLTPFIELGVGFNPELTGRENVFLNGALLGFDRKEMRGMYKDIVRFAELGKFMDQKLKNYSSGMQVRLAFSIAIRATSDILLIDEVLAVGDLPFQEKCYKVFEDIKASGRTVVFISHDGSAIERFCDRVAIIDKGDLVDVGESQEMVLKYGALVANEQYEQQQKGEEKHQGTGAITITDVSVHDKAGNPTVSIPFGEPFTVAVRYKLNKPINESVIAGIDIIDESGVSILGPNTQEVALDLEIKHGGLIEASFSNNPLAPNTYTVTAGIFNKNASVAFDLIEGGTTFKVIGKDRHGKIYIEPRWTVTESSKSISGASFEYVGRYQLIGEIITRYFAGQTKPKRILDVGGLGSILDKLVGIPVTILDNEVVDEADDQMLGSGSDMAKVADDSYEVVVSSDTLEHIPPADRRSFLRELVRVSSDLVVICSPFGDYGAAVQEATLQEIYTGFKGNSHRWLQEHVDYGLPTESKIVSYIPTDASHIVIHHSHLQLWRDLLAANLLANDMNDEPVHQKVEALNRLYNQEYLFNDFTASGYRNLIVISKKRQLSFVQPESSISPAAEAKLYRQITDFYEQVLKSSRQMPLIAAVQQQLAESEHDRDMLEGALKNLQHHFDNIVSSKTWRYSEFARKGIRGVKKVRNNRHQKGNR